MDYFEIRWRDRDGTTSEAWPWLERDGAEVVMHAIHRRGGMLLDVTRRSPDSELTDVTLEWTLAWDAHVAAVEAESLGEPPSAAG